MHPQNVTAVIGETVRLFCQLNSVPKAEIIWIFQNTSLTSTSEYKKYDLNFECFEVYVGENVTVRKRISKSISQNQFSIIIQEPELVVLIRV